MNYDLYTGQIVRLPQFPKTDINAYAVVLRVDHDGVWISNMNMPFQGTIPFSKYNFTDVAVDEEN